MILALIALPLAGALVVLLLRRLRLVSSLLSAGVLAILAASLLAQRGSDSWMFFGRAMDLPPLESSVLAYCFGLLALTLLYTRSMPQGELDYTVTLSVAALFIGAASLRNAALATLLLEGGIIASTILVPSERPGAAMSGIRILVLLGLCGALLLVAAWATEQYGVRGAEAQLAQVAAIALGLGLCVGLGVVPWHIWQVPTYQNGRVLAAIMLTVVAILI